MKREKSNIAGESCRASSWPSDGLKAISTMNEKELNSMATPPGPNYGGIILGALLMFGGFVLFLYFAFSFSITVDSVDSETVNNLGLVCSRVVGCVAGGVVFLFGLLLIIAQNVMNAIRLK